MAQSGISLRRINSVAIGPKRTSSAREADALAQAHAIYFIAVHG
jgi:hypothetical protein